MRRALAVVGAVIIIAIALLARSKLRASDGGGGNATNPTKATLRCIKELEAVCRDLQAANPDLVTVVIEDAGQTLAVLTAPGFSRSDTPLDAWLTTSPFPEMVGDRRARSGMGPLLDNPTRVLARSPAVVAIWRDPARQKTLTEHCGGDITWRCIGEVSGTRWTGLGGSESWGDVKPGVAPVAASATGLLTTVEAADSWFGRSDYASNDFDDPGFSSWLDRLAGAAKGIATPAGSPLDQMLFTGPAAADLAGDLEAHAGPAISASRDKDRLAIIYPSPLVTADAVVAPVAGSEAGESVKQLLESSAAAGVFARHGWRVGGHDSTAGIDTSRPLPDANGLPKPGVVTALRDRWAEAIR